jgi:hypothetical protein
MNANRPSLRIKIPNMSGPVPINATRSSRVPMTRSSSKVLMTPTAPFIMNNNISPATTINQNTPLTISSQTSTPLTATYTSYTPSSCRRTPGCVNAVKGFRIAPPKPTNINIRPYVGINNKPALTRNNGTRSLIDSSLKPYTGPKTLQHSNKTTRSLTKKGGRRTFYNPIKTRKLRR